MIRQKEISKPSTVRAGIIHGKRLQEASPGGFSEAQHQGGKGIQWLEPGKAVRGSRVRRLLLPASQGWVQLIAPHHRRVELLHTHAMGTSLSWQLSFQGRQGAAPCSFPDCVWGGQDRVYLHRSRLVLGTTRCLLSCWTCPFGKHWRRVFRGKWVILQNMLRALVPGSHNP